MDGRRNQPPLVDTTGCLCRVDVNLESNTLARKGSKLCIQSSVKPSIHPARQKSSNKGRPLNLIPGLPDDLAVACLTRVPRSEHRKLRLVCKKWKCLLAGRYFYSLRRSNGIVEEWIYIVKRDKDGKMSWDAFDPVSISWQPLPPVPAEYLEVVGFGCAVLGGFQLYLFGGKDPVRGSMRRVVFYNARTNRWHRAPDMLRRRHLFGYCVLNNCLYVSGGEGDGGRFLRTAEMYDPVRNRWFFVSEMPTAMVPSISAVYGGRWYLKGLGTNRELLSEVYIPESDGWQPVLTELLSGWRNPSICFNGKLYASDCKDGCKLRIYDDDTGSWSKRLDSKMHMGSSPALEAVGIVGLRGNKLCIVRNNLSMTLVDVGRSQPAWETIAGKGQIRNFVTNLWSNLAGLRNRVVHCHVLQA